MKLIKTRNVARGYTRPSYVCYDCGDVTAHVMLVYRGEISDFTKFFVHRAGSGCHKNDNVNDVREPVQS